MNFVNVYEFVCLTHPMPTKYVREGCRTLFLHFLKWDPKWSHIEHGLWNTGAE